MTNDRVKSQDEANAVFTYLVDETMRVEQINQDQAEKRVRALFDSGVLEGGNSESPETQMKINIFMKTPIA